MGLFSREPSPTIRTGYRKIDRHLDVVMGELQAAAQAGHGSYAVSVGWNQAIHTPAYSVPLYVDHLQKAGYEVESVNTPASGPATLIVRLGAATIQGSETSEPTVMGVPTPIKMIAAFDNGWLYAVHEDGVWRSRYIFTDQKSDMDLREYSSFQALCVNEGREHAQTMGSVGIVPKEMHEDFAAAFRAQI